jgi:anti-sigma factor RsiW
MPMNANEMTCEELIELVTDYLETALSPADRARFEEHLTNCPPCQAHLDQMKRTIETIGSLSVDSVPPKAERDLLDAFRDWKRA